MPEQWIIRVQGKEYGPADLATLREWRGEGRVIAANQARPIDVDLWTTAAEIPGLFEVSSPPPVQIEAAEPAAPRPRTKIFAQTFRIYFQGFFQFLGLTLLVVGPSICAQLTGALVEATPNVDVDLRKLVEGAFVFCMLLLSTMLWPVYIAGVQIVTAQRAAGQRSGFLGIVNEAVKFWPRVAMLCLIVYGVFALLMLLALAIAAMLVAGASSLLSIFVALALLAFQIWMFGRWFINVLFWQQTAVLEGADVVESLRRSKQIARGGGDLPWYRRSWWRGALIASLWLAFVFAINWPLLSPYLHMVMTASDTQALLESLRVAGKSPSTSEWLVPIWLTQKILQPLLGIAFVLLYLDNKP